VTKEAKEGEDPPSLPSFLLSLAPELHLYAAPIAGVLISENMKAIKIVATLLSGSIFVDLWYCRVKELEGRKRWRKMKVENVEEGEGN
jgi:hypothetical protein